MPSISEYIPYLPGTGEGRKYTKKQLTTEKRKFLRKRAKLARKITRNNHK